MQNPNMRVQNVNGGHAEGLKAWDEASPGETGQKSTRVISASGHLGSQAAAKPNPTSMVCGLLPRNPPPKPLPSKAFSTDMTFLVRCKLDKS